MGIGVQEIGALKWRYILRHMVMETWVERGTNGVAYLKGENLIFYIND